MSPLQIWITRSQPGADRLAQHLGEANFAPLVAPVLTIEALALLQPLPDRIDVAIALSEHAVQHCPRALWQRAQRVVAVGARTHGALASLGLDAELPGLASSEGLLAGPLKGLGVQHERVALVSGRGGRTLLAEQLLAVGASVYSAEVYARVPVPQVSVDLRSVDAIVVSSGDGFEAAGRLWFEAIQRPDVPVFAPSQRVAEMATRFGFDAAQNCGGADPQSVLAALQRYRKNL